MRATISIFFLEVGRVDIKVNLIGDVILDPQGDSEAVGDYGHEGPSYLNA